MELQTPFDKAMRNINLLDRVDAIFGFCNEKKPGKGEDSWCYSLNEQSCLLGVFDGCGGLGAMTYERMKGHTGAYLASRAAAAATMKWFDSDDGGEKRDTASLKKHILDALSICMQTANAAPSRLSGSMIRLMPTTAAIWLLESGENALHAASFSVGDSRTYLLDADGLAQISRDDIANEDAMSNLYDDGILTNVVSADGRFSIAEANYSLTKPCVLFSATDGCFGYFRSPMEFEYLLIESLESSKCIDEWKEKLERRIGKIAGDDYTIAFAVYGYGTFEKLHDAMQSRFMQLEELISGFGDSFDLRQEAWKHWKPEYYRLAKGREPVDAR